MSYANLSPDWQDSVNAAARETETKAGADAASTMRAYFLPCTWEHQWTWSLFSSRNLGVSLILSSLSCEHIIGDSVLCLLTRDSSKPINCVIMIDQPEVVLPPPHPFIPSCLLLLFIKKKKKRMEEKERQQSKSSNKQHKRFICEGQTLTARIAAGVWGKPVYFGKPTRKSWVQTNCLLQREYCVGGYGNNYVLGACFTFCGFSPTWNARTARVTE